MKNLFKPKPIWMISLWAFCVLFVSCNKNKQQDAMLPEVSTKATKLFNESTVIVESEVISDGGTPLLSKGICWGLIPEPTVSNSPTVQEGSGIGRYTSFISNLEYLNKYYVRSFATNEVGTAYGEEKVICTSIPLGVRYGGGIVVYIYKQEDNFITSSQCLSFSQQDLYIEGEVHGLIAAEENIEIGSWSCGYDPNLPPPFSTSNKIGRGYYNTCSIVNSCSLMSAARRCWDAEINGYTDWFLPSGLELHLFMTQRLLVDSVLAGTYWTSTDVSHEYAIAAMLNATSPPNIHLKVMPKYMPNEIRPFRNF